MRFAQPSTPPPRAQWPPRPAARAATTPPGASAKAPASRPPHGPPLRSARPDPSAPRPPSSRRPQADRLSIAGPERLPNVTKDRTTPMCSSAGGGPGFVAASVRLPPSSRRQNASRTRMPGPASSVPGEELELYPPGDVPLEDVIERSAELVMQRDRPGSRGPLTAGPAWRQLDDRAPGERARSAALAREQLKRRGARAGRRGAGPPPGKRAPRRRRSPTGSGASARIARQGTGTDPHN